MQQFEIELSSGRVGDEVDGAFGDVNVGVRSVMAVTDQMRGRWWRAGEYLGLVVDPREPKRWQDNAGFALIVAASLVVADLAGDPQKNFLVTLLWAGSTTVVLTLILAMIRRRGGRRGP